MNPDDEARRFAMDEGAFDELRDILAKSDGKPSPELCECLARVAPWEDIAGAQPHPTNRN